MSLSPPWLWFRQVGEAAVTNKDAFKNTVEEAIVEEAVYYNHKTNKSMLFTKTRVYAPDHS